METLAREAGSEACSQSVGLAVSTSGQATDRRLASSPLEQTLSWEVSSCDHTAMEETKLGAPGLLLEAHRAVQTPLHEANARVLTRAPFPLPLAL